LPANRFSLVQPQEKSNTVIVLAGYWLPNPGPSTSRVGPDRSGRRNGCPSQAASLPCRQSGRFRHFNCPHIRRSGSTARHRCCCREESGPPAEWFSGLRAARHSALRRQASTCGARNCIMAAQPCHRVGATVARWQAARASSWPARTHRRGESTSARCTPCP
jgi:hypothetical protein